MNLWAQLGQWLTTSANWQGGTGVPVRVAEHLQYTGLTMLFAIVIAIPIGVLVGHTGRGGFLVVGIANGLRALPTLGLLTIVVLAAGLGLAPPILALTVLAIPPLLAGTYAGIRAVDAAVVDAAKGVGMRGWQVILRVEIPNALPLIFGGIRSAALQVIATATIAAYVGLGGLGRYVIDGLSQQHYDQALAGALIVAVLAIVIDLVLVIIQRVVVSPGLNEASLSRRSGRRTENSPAPGAEVVHTGGSSS
ncbi:MAG TPA: ABC transporter permease [Pseudonocardiaceae bacterium]